MDAFKIDPDREVLAGLSRNHKLTQALIEYFCLHRDQDFRRNTLRQAGGIPESVLLKMIPSSSPRILKLMLDLLTTSDEVMKVLAKSIYPEVRCMVARKARCESVLEPLYSDKNPIVFYFLSQNPNADAKKLDTINPRPSVTEVEAAILKYRQKERYFSWQMIIEGLFRELGELSR